MTVGGGDIWGSPLLLSGAEMWVVRMHWGETGASFHEAFEVERYPIAGSGDLDASDLVVTERLVVVYLAGVELQRHVEEARPVEPSGRRRLEGAARTARHYCGVGRRQHYSGIDGTCLDRNSVAT